MSSDETAKCGHDYMEPCHCDCERRIRVLEAQLSEEKALRTDAEAAVKIYCDDYNAEHAKLAIAVEALERIDNDNYVLGGSPAITLARQTARAALSRIRGTK